MYKVFINNLPVLVMGSGEKAENESGRTLRFPADNEAQKEILNLMDLHRNEPLTIIGTESAEKMLQIAFAGFKRIDAAGGLVLDDHKRLLLIYRNDKWDLPKGKIDKGEVPQDAALREVMEECGLQGHTLGEELPSTWHCYEHKGNRVLKRTYWFIMRHSGKQQLMPQLEENITKVEWRSMNDLSDVISNTYPSVLDCISELQKRPGVL